MGAQRKFLNGQLLLDSGQLGGSFFQHTVLLICKHDAEGAFGLVLNRTVGKTVGELIVADLPELVSGKAPPPATGRHRYFRSIGLGLEDIAMAAEIHRVLTGAQKDN